MFVREYIMPREKTLDQARELSTNSRDQLPLQRPVVGHFGNPFVIASQWVIIEFFWKRVFGHEKREDCFKLMGIFPLFKDALEIALEL